MKSILGGKHPEDSLGRPMESSYECEFLLPILPRHYVIDGMSILGNRLRLERLGLVTSSSVVIQIDEKVACKAVKASNGVNGIDDNSQHNSIHSPRILLDFRSRNPIPLHRTPGYLVSCQP